MGRVTGLGIMLRKVLDGLYLLAGYAAGVFLVAIFVLMMVLSAGRPLGINLPAGDTLVSASDTIPSGKLLLSNFPTCSTPSGSEPPGSVPPSSPRPS